jgi:hypothetical protein
MRSVPQRVTYWTSRKGHENKRLRIRKLSLIRTHHPGPLRGSLTESILCGRRESAGGKSNYFSLSLELIQATTADTTVVMAAAIAGGTTKFGYATCATHTPMATIAPASPPARVSVSTSTKSAMAAAPWQLVRLILIQLILQKALRGILEDHYSIVVSSPDQGRLLDQTLKR